MQKYRFKMFVVVNFGRKGFYLKETPYRIGCYEIVAFRMSFGNGDRMSFLWLNRPKFGMASEHFDMLSENLENLDNPKYFPFLDRSDGILLLFGISIFGPMRRFSYAQPCVRI